MKLLILLLVFTSLARASGTLEVHSRPVKLTIMEGQRAVTVPALLNFYAPTGGLISFTYISKDDVRSRFPDMGARIVIANNFSSDPKTNILTYVFETMANLYGDNLTFTINKADLSIDIESHYFVLPQEKIYILINEKTYSLAEIALNVYQLSYGHHAILTFLVTSDDIRKAIRAELTRLGVSSRNCKDLLASAAKP